MIFRVRWTTASRIEMLFSRGDPSHETKSDAFLGGATERAPTVSLARVQVLASFFESIVLQRHCGHVLDVGLCRSNRPVVQMIGVLASAGLLKLPWINMKCQPLLLEQIGSWPLEPAPKYHISKLEYLLFEVRRCHLPCSIHCTGWELSVGGHWMMVQRRQMLNERSDA